MENLGYEKNELLERIFLIGIERGNWINVIPKESSIIRFDE